MEEMHCDHNGKCASGEGEGGARNNNGQNRREVYTSKCLTTIHIALCPTPFLCILLALSSKIMCRGNGFSPMKREKEGTKLLVRKIRLYLSQYPQEYEWQKFFSLVCRMPQSCQGSLARAVVLHLWYTLESPSIF